MEADDAKKILLNYEGQEEPVFLPAAVMNSLAREDLPKGVRLGIGEVKKGVTHVDWSGYLLRDGQDLYAEVEFIWTRKYWYQPLNLEHYLDLVKRTVERRESNRGDVKLIHSDDDGAYVQLIYAVYGLPTKNLGAALKHARQISTEMEEHAQAASDAAGRMAAEQAQRADGWGETPLDQLVENVETAKDSNTKGRTLEELVARLFEQVGGLQTIGRIRTSTEEIDITILNGSEEVHLARESAIILVECKNWTGRCGKNEFVVFREKIENRSSRSSLGFLVSWNGFTETVTKEMLRGTRESTLVVPLDGKQIRAAVRDDSFEKTIFDAWQKAVML